MTADRDPVQRYLDQLRLSLRIPEVGRILVEAEDHLREATAAGMAAGLTEREAQQAAIASFGSVRAIVYAHQTRHGRVAAMLADLAIALWRVFAFYLLAFFSLGLYGLLMPDAQCTTHSRSCELTTLVPETSPLATVISWAVMGAAGVALLTAYFLIRCFQRRRGRVWSVPLGGYFPLTATLVSIAVGTGLLMLRTGAGVSVPGEAVIIFGALGLAVTYGARMWGMLRHQADESRDWG